MRQKAQCPQDICLFQSVANYYLCLSFSQIDFQICKTNALHVDVINESDIYFTPSPITEIKRKGLLLFFVTNKKLFLIMLLIKNGTFLLLKECKYLKSYFLPSSCVCVCVSLCVLLKTPY